MPKKQDVIAKLRMVEDYLEEDVEYNTGILQFENRLVMFTIEHPEWSKNKK